MHNVVETMDYGIVFFKSGNFIASGIFCLHRTALTELYATSAPAIQIRGCSFQCLPVPIVVPSFTDNAMSDFYNAERWVHRIIFDVNKQYVLFSIIGISLHVTS